MATCEFFYDFSSPFSYLASTQIERVAEGHRLVWRPFLLGAVFKAVGTPIVPIASFPRPKRILALREQYRWAEHWGVDFALPAVFPQNTVLALRMALQLPEDRLPAATHAFFRAVWVEDRNLGDREALREVALGAGLDADRLIAGAETPEVKALLRTNTDEAVARGAFGAPSFFVGDQLFWGQDRLDFVRRALEGWKPREPGPKVLARVDDLSGST